MQRGPFSATEKAVAVGSVPLTLALAAPMPLAKPAAPGYSLPSCDNVHVTLSCPSPECWSAWVGVTKSHRWGSLDITAWRLDILGGGIGNFGCLGPTVEGQSPVWAGVGDSRGMPGTLSRYRAPSQGQKATRHCGSCTRKWMSLRWRSSTCPPLHWRKGRRTPTGTPGQVRAWDRSGPRIGQGSSEMSEASWNMVRHQPGWAHRTQAGIDPEKQAGLGNNSRASATIRGDWCPALGPRRQREPWGGSGGCGPSDGVGDAHCL